MSAHRSLARMARTLQAFHRGFGEAGRDAHVVELPGVVASVCPAIGFRSIFNAAAYAEGGQLANALPTLRDEWAAAGVTACAVWAHESDLGTTKLLEDAGFRIDSTPTAMAAPIAAIEAPHGGVTIEPVRDLTELDAVLADAYGFPAGVVVYCFPRLLESFRCSLARDDAGRAVAALATVDADGDLGFTLVGTTNEARGRGFASELLRRAAVDAAARGCTTTSLQATAMGRGVYARLGYEPLGVYRLWEHRSPPPR
jgi:GNAT superfamily N-acetyltransferase